jgi:hypothetical protein
MPFAGKKAKPPHVDRQAHLAAKPVRMVEAEAIRGSDGAVSLIVPVAKTSVALRFFRAPAGAKKTFELDAMGTMVWDQIDGRTSVQQIIRRLAKQYGLSHREAEVATLAFLKTLTRKSLIGMQLKTSQSVKS